MTRKTRLGDMQRWIYISPHFDDAALSCGGLIWEQAQEGTPVEIWTIFAGDAPPGPLSMLAQVCHFQWGMKTADEVLAARRVENLAATALLGAETADFSIPDCIYRRSPEGDPLYPDDIFVPIHPSEAGLAKDIAAVIISELLPGDAVVAPLSIGSHPDHLLATRAAELLGLPIHFYADVPYQINNPSMLDPVVKDMKATVHPISDQGLQAWQDAIAAYTSQMPMLFDPPESMRDAIRNYWQTRHGICLWQEE
jgi:LmbE family N-acetylglucosaminyl deacetylase